MAEANGDAGGQSGSWYRVPTWDGSPATWREFRREMKWWLHSLDLKSTAKYNLAARWLIRQTGIVRQRGEEFDPDELAYKPAEMGVDPESGEEVELVPADYLCGLNKLLNALESINGRTQLDKRGELRQQFYVDLRRKAGERTSEFSTRFRTLVADLKSEGVIIQDAELGWFLREKLGLDPLRRQLLDTALQGDESYGRIEAEILRLFKDLHQSDPLYRKAPQDGFRPKLTVRRMFDFNRSGGVSSATSTAPSRSLPSSSGSSWKRPMSAAASSVGYRRALVTEAEQEPEAEVDEVYETAAEEPVAEDAPALEEYLMNEAEVFAAELKDAEECGIDAQVLEELEADFEQAAETLVTMKEARSRLNEIRKDRGFNKGGPGSTKGNVNVPSSKKASGKHPCFDCGLHGHWAGDKECQRPGAGLARKTSVAAAKQKPRQVRITEACHADHLPDGHLESDPKVDLVGKSQDLHEASVVSHDGLFGMPLDQALFATAPSREHSTLASVSTLQVLADDKHLVGALDSACNRTCAGPQWLDGYMLELRRMSPSWIVDLIESHDEQENFRFGNGGLVTSSRRWRVPALVSGKLILIWISVVPVGTLGCLLGRDFLDAVGGVLDFAAKTLQCTFLSAEVPPQRLNQMSAGHFILPLIPKGWPRPISGRWRKCGLDGIIELQMAPQQWLDRKLSSRISSSSVCSHDQMIAEDCGSAAAVHEVLSANCDFVVQDMSVLTDHDSSRQHPLQEVCYADPRDLCEVRQRGARCAIHSTCGTEAFDGRLQVGLRSVPMAPLHHEAPRKVRLACPKFAVTQQLWLLQRSYLRFLPCPYPSIASVEDWKFQAKTMADQLVMVPDHWRRARDMDLFTSQNLLEMSRFRDRVGWKFAFMEDSILSGLMAVKATRGVSTKLKTAALAEARMSVEKEKKQGQQMEAARELIGPRGGLPTLKTDLIKLALLCDVEVKESDTVPMLQARIRPVVATIRNAEPKTAAKASTRSSKPEVSTTRELTSQAAGSEQPAVESMRSMSPELMTQAQMSTMLDSRLHSAILEQDQRLQTMMAQVMVHIEERFKHMPQVMMPMPDQLPNGPAMDDSTMEAMMPPNMPR